MPGAEESDESLLARYARGESAAFETLYNRHEMRVWRYLERNVANQAIADELMQDVWFAVARDAARYTAAGRFTSWLFTIARNRMLDSRRTSRPQLSLEVIGHEATPVVEQLSTEIGPVNAVVARDQAAALAEALRQLPHEQRDAFLLHVEGELSVEEIAALTRSSFETTKSRLRYARAKLRKLLDEFA